MNAGATTKTHARHAEVQHGRHKDTNLRIGAATPPVRAR